MIYPKPKKLKYTDMAKFFDKNFWSDNPDEVTCYKYLYLIFDMLAHTKDMFKLNRDYENFSLFAATTIYMRFLKRKRNGKEKIKSVLNYAKFVTKHLRVMYLEQEYSSSIINCVKEGAKVDISQMKEYLRAPVRNQYNSQIEDSMRESFKELPQIITEVVSTTPYKKNKIVTRNIELSCIMTLFKSFIIDDKLMGKVSNNQQNNKVESIFSEARKNSVTLFRLDEDMRDTITLLCNKIRKKFSERLMNVIQENTIQDDVVDSILTTAWDSTCHQEVNDTNLNFEDTD